MLYVETHFSIIFYTPFSRGLIPYAFLIYFLVKIKICLYNSCSSLPLTLPYGWEGGMFVLWEEVSTFTWNEVQHIFFNQGIYL